MKKYVSICLLGSLMLITSLSAMALTVTISQQRNSCNQILTATITGGSGNYQLGWGVSGGCVLPPNSSSPTLVTLPCGNNANYFLFVLDLNTNDQAFAQIAVSKVLMGSLSVGLPNVITPNGDGINDTFDILTGSFGTGPTNAHTINVNIYNRWGAQVFNQTYTDYNSGIIANYPTWNGGSSASGTYFAEVTATNCSTSQSYNVQITLLR